MRATFNIDAYTISFFSATARKVKRESAEFVPAILMYIEGADSGNRFYLQFDGDFPTRQQDAEIYYAEMTADLSGHVWTRSDTVLATVTLDDPCNAFANYKEKILDYGANRLYRRILRPDGTPAMPSIHLRKYVSPSDAKWVDGQDNWSALDILRLPDGTIKAQKKLDYVSSLGLLGTATDLVSIDCAKKLMDAAMLDCPVCRRAIQCAADYQCGAWTLEQLNSASAKLGRYIDSLNGLKRRIYTFVFVATCPLSWEDRDYYCRQTDLPCTGAEPVKAAEILASIYQKCGIAHADARAKTEIIQLLISRLDRLEQNEGLR